MSLCGRCYDEVDVLVEPPCDEKPETLAGAPIGMYHCPDCGAMVLAGIPHPNMCSMCLNEVLNPREDATNEAQDRD